MNFKKIVIEIVSIAFAIAAVYCCANGCMEYLAEHNYLNLGEHLATIFGIVFSLIVFLCSYKGLNFFLLSAISEDKEE